MLSCPDIPPPSSLPDDESNSIIFYHPLPVEPGGRSGSRVRPYRMLEGFGALGYDVDVVAGYAEERKQAAARVQDAIARGKRYAFLYAESSTMPTFLTDPHHLPLRPLFDYRFLRRCKEASIPIGIFYRDVHWRFPLLKREVSPVKRFGARIGYELEWAMYAKYATHLFLPSVGMKTALPESNGDLAISALPPGAPASAVGEAERPRVAEEGLRLFYVGGVRPPTYDLRPMLRAVSEAASRSDRVHLTLCCREEEWAACAPLYDGLLRGVRVVHATGADLQELYRTANVFLYVPEPSNYLDFAMPVKLFEAMGHGLPVIAHSATEAGRFVQKHEVGWSVAGTDALAGLMEQLHEDPALVSRTAERVRAEREHHTWVARARQVSRVLRAGSSRPEPLAP